MTSKLRCCRIQTPVNAESSTELTADNQGRSAARVRSGGQPGGSQVVVSVLEERVEPLDAVSIDAAVVYLEQGLLVFSAAPTARERLQPIAGRAEDSAATGSVDEHRYALDPIAFDVIDALLAQGTAHLS